MKFCVKFAVKTFEDGKVSGLIIFDCDTLSIDKDVFRKAEKLITRLSGIEDNKDMVIISITEALV